MVLRTGACSACEAVAAEVSVAGAKGPFDVALGDIVTKEGVVCVKGIVQWELLQRVVGWLMRFNDDALKLIELD
jgi:hypothetical protein